MRGGKHPMRKLLVLFALTFAIFACSNDCLNVANECLNGRYSEKKDNENNQSNDNNSNKEEPGKRFTTLQEVVDKTNAGEEIDLSDYELIDYNATIDKKITIKNGSLSNAKLTVTSENVKLESLTDLSVLASSRLTISESKLSSLLIGGNSETSRSRASEPQTSLAMVSLTDSEIAEVQLNGFNSQLNITDTDTKIDDIVTSTKSKIILEAGKYEGMKDPVVTDNGELTRIDMTKDKTLSILSIYSNPNKAEYKLNEEIDLTGLIVMGTYTASVEIFKSGGWKGEAIESVTKWEDEKDYDVDYDFSKTGVRIVTIKSTINPDVACNFYVYVVDDSQNGETSKPEKIEFTNIRVESLLQTPKTSYKVGEKLDLSGYRVMGTYNGLDVNLQYTSDPANGTVLSEGGEITVTFYYNGTSVAINNPIKISVAQPYIVTFKVGNDVYCTTEMAHGESLKLPSDPNRENYTFAGWYIGDKKVTSGSSVESNLELIAKWEAIECCLILKVDGKQTIKVGKYNDKVNILNPELKDGYTFAGWNPPLPEIYSTETTTHEAQWTANKYTVKFNANGGSGTMTVQTFTYDIEQELTVNAFTLDGFTFAGWALSVDGSAVYMDKASVKNLATENNATVTLYAKWTKKGTVSVVFFNPQSGTEVDCDDSVSLSCETVGAEIYYTIDNLKYKYTDSITITKDVTIVAYATKDGMSKSEYSSADYTVKTYTVTFKTEHGTELDKIDGLKKGDKLTSEQLPTLTVDGYTFGGWYNGETKIEAGYTVTCDLELTAQWEANKYTVQFNANGGSGTMDDQTFAYDEQKALTANTFARTGYTFAGWNTQANGSGTNYSDKASVSNLTATANGEVTLYAKWKIETYTITYYNCDGATNGNPESYHVETGTIKLENPTRTGYTFGGWYTDNNFSTDKKVTQIAKGSTGNIILYAQWAEAEANAYYVSNNGDDSKAGTYFAPFKTLQKAVDTAITSNDGETTYTIYVMNNITGTDSDFDTTNCALINIVPTEKLNLKISGYNNTVKTINAQQKGRVMFIYGEANVTLENITLTGGKVNNNFGAGVVVSYFGELTMKTGTTISNCKAETSNNSYGGGVYVYGGTFDMFDGTISNCTASYGGGVSVEEGTFTMYGGSIENCTSNVEESGGGGIYLASGTVTMSGNAKISECNADNTLSDKFCCGGGVYVADGIFTLSEEASIDDCNALSTSDSRYGGGVYLAGGTFDMTGGSIKNCDVAGFNDYGGGVYQNAGSFTMSGGTISNCTAEQGGGVYKKGGSFQMQGGTIGGGDETLGCTADLGGGVYLGDSGSSSISSGIINNCSAKQGGGVYYNGSSMFAFNMFGGEISNCTADLGGGVYVDKGKFEMSGSAKIDACTAKEQGGGVYQNSGIFTIAVKTNGTNNVIISNNTAKSGGGVYVAGGNFNMSSGEIKDNKLNGNDGAGIGVYVLNGTFNNNGGTISDEIYPAQ